MKQYHWERNSSDFLFICSLLFVWAAFAYEAVEPVDFWRHPPFGALELGISLRRTLTIPPHLLVLYRPPNFARTVPLSHYQHYQNHFYEVIIVFCGDSHSKHIFSEYVI